MKKAIEDRALKALDNLVSVKCFVLVTATAFLLTGKISENTWQETVLVIGGLRCVTDITSIVKTRRDQKRPDEIVR